MTLTELQKLSDEAFAYKAAWLLKIHREHKFKTSHPLCRCCLCDTIYRDRHRYRCVCNMDLDWNTAMPMLLEAMKQPNYYIDGLELIYTDGEGGWVKPIKTEREVITAVLLARGLVKGE